jgi:hypothetical protein
MKTGVNDEVDFRLEHIIDKSVEQGLNIPCLIGLYHLNQHNRMDLAQMHWHIQLNSSSADNFQYL